MRHGPSTVQNPVWDRKETRSSLARDLGECVYFIRCKDGAIKIGWTKNLPERRHALHVPWDSVLAVLPGNREDEKRLHQMFEADRAYKREYFHPSENLMNHVNGIRAQLGVPPVPDQR